MVAEHDSEREPEEKEAPADTSAGTSPGTSPGAASPPSGTPAGDRQDVPFDEDAAWRAIVAGYGQEPPDPPGAKPFKSVEDLALLDTDANDTGAKPVGKSPEESSDPSAEQGGPASTTPLGSSVVFAPGVGGPRDYRLAEPAEDDLDEDDEGHFVPPEPPPLPAADTTARFAWLGVIGGPLLLLLAVLLGWHMTWWLTTLSIGGFLGGFATLVMRMKDGDEEDEDPGRGAVV